MKITRYMGAFAVIAMLAACSTDDELGANSAANEVKIAATVGGNSIFTRSNPVGTEEEQTSFNEGDAISVTTEGTTVIYKKTAEVWAPVNAAEFLLWTGNAQTFEACYPEKADDNSTKKFFLCRLCLKRPINRYENCSVRLYDMHKKYRKGIYTFRQTVGFVL